RPGSRAPLAERHEERGRASARVPLRLRAARRMERRCVVHDHRPSLWHDDRRGRVPADAAGCGALLPGASSGGALHRAGIDWARLRRASGYGRHPRSRSIGTMIEIATLGGGFLLAVLWMDLMFDVQVLRHRRDRGDLPEDVLASIAGYYRR